MDRIAKPQVVVPAGEDPDAARLGDPCSPYLTSDEAARYLRFKSPVLFRQWAKRQGLRPGKRGRVLLWERRYLDAVVSPPRLVPQQRGRRR